MKYTLTLSFDTPEELIAYLAANAGGTGAADKPARTKAKPPVEDDEPAPKKAAAKKPAPADDDEDEMDYQKDIRPLVVGLSKDHGREAALEVLELFTNPATDDPCTKGDQVDPADWPKLLKKIAAKRKALEADAD